MAVKKIASLLFYFENKGGGWSVWTATCSSYVHNFNQDILIRDDAAAVAVVQPYNQQPPQQSFQQGLDAVAAAAAAEPRYPQH